MLYLRYLDIDDLIILTSLLNSVALKDIAKSMGLTPPALTHRLNKYRLHIPNFNLHKKTKGCTKKAYPLDDQTRQICIKAKQALDTLSNEAA